LLLKQYKEIAMRRWYLPLTVIGLGGLSAFLFTERGRAVLNDLIERFQQAPDRLADWNDSFENELDRIQETLNRIADTLDPHTGLGEQPGH
jgi:hypothetical protein